MCLDMSEISLTVTQSNAKQSNKKHNKTKCIAVKLCCVHSHLCDAFDIFLHIYCLIFELFPNSGNVLKRPSGNYKIDMWTSYNIMKSPSPKYYIAFWDMTIYSDTLVPQWSDITPIGNLITELDLITDFLITKFQEVSIEHWHGCVEPTEDAFSSGHLVLFHLGLAFILMLRPFSFELVMFPEFKFEHPLVLLYG